MQKIEYNDKFKQALDQMKTGQNPLFITGNAGTGKSTLLSIFLKNNKKNVVVLAPTGVAALNVKGMTIHSFFGFQPGITVDKAREKGNKVKNNSLLRSMEMIIIDEISMVRADLLDCIDAYLKAAFRKKLPFGGIRMVFIGDLYQLSPILVSQEKAVFETLYESPYFFSAKVMKEVSFELLELEKIYRQKDISFIEVLNAIRKNSVTEEQLAFINKRVIKVEDEGFIHLTTTNKEVSRINEEKLEKLPGKLYTFNAIIEGEFNASNSPTAEGLKIKKQSQVMLLTNHPEGLWVNGTVGTVTGIDDEEIIIETQDGETISVGQHKWDLYQYRLDEKSSSLVQDVIGSFIQYPLCLAWAITVHKSQGKTFDRAIVDLSGSFATGQAYVALSRCRSFDGLILKKPVQKGHIRVDPHVVRFLTEWQYEISDKNCSLEEKTNLIKKAIEEKGQVKMVYLKSNDEKSSRQVKPLTIGIMEFKDKKHLGMEAYCTKRNENRTFRIDRILELSLAY
jgi:ATP-dependent exoDNAse (exonuclease V) alpha subunit